jgi:LPXTG-motif cell wall-anchored protein
VDWWNLHNGTDQAPTTVNGRTDYQDGGMLSAGTCAGGTCEPQRDTPFPTYWGIRSLTALAQPGDTMVESSSGNPSVAVHAVRSSNGGLNVMLINKSPQSAAQVSLSYAGFTPAAGTVTTVSYGTGGTGLTTAQQGTAVAQTLPPYSITTLHLKPASGTAGVHKPSAAATPTAAAPVVSASGTIGTRAQAGTGAPVAQPTPISTSGSLASGSLASTGVSSTVTYSALGGLLAIIAGSVLVLRGHRRRALHGK